MKLHRWIILCIGVQLLSSCFGQYDNDENIKHTSEKFSVLPFYLDQQLPQAVRVANSDPGQSAAPVATGPAVVSDINAVPTLDAPAISELMAMSTDPRIEPDDTLNIIVLGINELNRTVVVSQVGEIDLPLIGRVVVRGKLPVVLEEEVEALYERSYLQAPEIKVVLIKSKRKPLTLGGAVGRPGSVAYTGPTTLLEAVALGGGTTALANRGNIYVFRTINDHKNVARYDIEKIARGEAKDPKVLPGDVVIVDYSDTTSFLIKIGRALPLVNFFIPLALLFN